MAVPWSIPAAADRAEKSTFSQAWTVFLHGSRVKNVVHWLKIDILGCDGMSWPPVCGPNRAGGRWSPGALMGILEQYRFLQYGPADGGRIE
ncbi:hypothetical protein [Amorphus sp. MBR-141]|jgi:hypothetical protein